MAGGWWHATGAAVASIAAAGALTAPAPDSSPTPFAKPAPVIYTVTLAARTCEAYSQIMANRVRGDGQDSLARLGPDTVYHPGQAVDPQVEASASRGCQPLTGWRFTFGQGYTRSGAMSIVKSPNGSAGPTQTSTPLLDRLGQPTGQDLPGAVTVTLTEQQAQLAQQHRLWVQGGRVDDPTGGLGFGTLRCALDNGNGNNVEWIGFPAGTRHVFCFAYYVKPRPALGALVVRQEVTRKLGYPQRFAYASPASLAAGGAFALTTSGDPVSTTLLRTTGTYPVSAQLPAGWRLASLQCASSKSGVSSWTAADATATVVLGAGDTVTCTYLVEPPANPTGLTIRVATSGGLGQFGYEVQGGPGARRQSATTEATDTATAAGGDDTLGLPPGQYTIAQTLPDSALWTLAGVTCNGTAAALSGQTATVTLGGGPVDCVFHNRRRAGTLTVRLVTLGGTGTAGFTVTSGDDGWYAMATTDQLGPPVRAGGDLPDRLPYGTYAIQSTPPATTAQGGWQFTEFTCSPGTYEAAGPGQEGALTIEITESVPDAVCTAVYERTQAATMIVVARAAGEVAGRTAPLVLDVQCVDGATGRLVLTPDQAGPATLPAPLTFPAPTSCTIAGTSTVDEQVTYQATAGEQELSLPGTVQVGQSPLTVTIVAAYGAGAAQPPIKRQETPLLPMAVIGVGVAVLVALLILVVVVRRASR